jgi:hypothetical protein
MEFEQMLKPKPGFDWNHISWGKPDSVRSALCSYCSAGIAEGSVPLILSTGAGYTAQFCDDCQRRWWGIETFAGDDDEQAS